MKHHFHRHWRGFSVLRILFISFLLITMILPQHAARAASIRRVKPSGLTTGQCTAWLEACSLQRALSLSVAGDEIWALAGAYKPTVVNDRAATFQLKSGVGIYGGFIGTETTRDQRDPAAHVSILTGEILLATPADNSYHVVTGSGVDSTAVLDGFTITMGYANGIGANQTLGAGLYIDHGSPTLVNVIFSLHTATHGGAVYNIGGSPVFNRVSFINNTSSNNGAAIWNGSGAAPILTNVTFKGGDAGGSGGGMYNDQSSPFLTNVTFNDNVAASGGAMTNANASAPAIRSSILWGNSASTDAEIHNLDTSTAAVTYSVVESGYAGTGNTAEDPLLGPLGTYGSSLQLLPLLPGSPAIDTGDPAACAVVDARGISRPQGVRCDMGAFESRGFTLSLSSGDAQSTDINTTFAQHLAVGISSSFGEPVEGGQIHFSGPASGPGADFSPASAAIAMGGASTTATANGFGGSYTVTASAYGPSTPVIFHLTNIGPPGFIIYLPLIFK